MTEAGRGWVRIARATVAVGVTLGLAAAGHAAGGGPVSSGALLVLVVLLTPVALVATAVPWTFGRGVAALGSGQVGVHLLLTLMAPASGGTALAPHAGHAGHGDLPAGLGSGGLAGAAAALHLTPSMLGWHVGASLVAAAVIAFGERALWAALARLLPDLPAGPALPVGPVAAPAWRHTRPRGILLLLPPGRGPPAGPPATPHPSPTTNLC